LPLSDEEERDLKEALMRADLALKQKQAFWETPRNIAILLGAVAGLTGVVFGILGYKIGQNSPPTQIVFQPGSIVLQQPAAPATK